MKKIIVLVLAIVMMLSLAACGSKVNKITFATKGANGVEVETYYEINGHTYTEEEYEKLCELGFKG